MTFSPAAARRLAHFAQHSNITELYSCRLTAEPILVRYFQVSLSSEQRKNFHSEFEGKPISLATVHAQTPQQSVLPRHYKMPCV
jgi:hypothetical protein